MRALVYRGPREMALEEVPEPRPAEGEALVAVEAVGICGSDMHAYLGHDARRPPPLILGHEAAGVALTGAFEGRRVTVNPLVTCGACPACLRGRENLCPHRQILSMPPREGAFAERLAIPERNLVAVPEGVSPAQAALAEPLACGWHALRLGVRALDIPLGEARVLVIGGGAIGLGAALAAIAQGAERPPFVAETNAARRAALAAVPGIAPIDPAETDLAQADLVIDAVGGARSRAAASEKVRPGGVILHIGLGGAEGGLDMRRVTLQEITVIGTYTYTRRDFAETAEAIFTGRLGDLAWAEIRPLAAGVAAFPALLAGAVSAPKIVLTPGA